MSFYVVQVICVELQNAVFELDDQSVMSLFVEEMQYLCGELDCTTDCIKHSEVLNRNRYGYKHAVAGGHDQFKIQVRTRSADIVRLAQRLG